MILADAIEQQYEELEWAGAPTGFGALAGLLILAAAVYLVVFLYRRERRGGPGPRLRGFLTVLRCAALLALAVIWLDPVVATYTVRTLVGRLVVLVDNSESMTIADAGPDAAERLAAVKDLLGRDEGQWLQRLADRNQLRVYSFGADLSQVEVGAERIDPARLTAALDRMRADAPLTDFGLALNRTVREAGESPLAGVVVLTDGAFNEGLAPEALANLAERVQAPLFPVAVGRTETPPNVRIAELAAPDTAAKGDPLAIEVSVAYESVAAREVELRLYGSSLEADDPAPKLIETRPLQLQAGAGTLPETFRLAPQEAGEALYRVEVAALPDEPVIRDNSGETIVRILDEELRVLIVSGRPSYDYRYVTRLLERDASIDVSCWLQSADERAIRDGDTVIDALPRTTEALFAYDVVLLLDPSPADLDAAWALALRRLVDEFGGGLLVQAGSHFSARMLRDPRLEELVRLLPVTTDPDAAVRLSSQGAYRTQAVSLEVSGDALGHPLVALDPDATRNRAIWDALPGVWWHLPVLEAKPLATVLLEYGGPGGARYGKPVLLAAQPFGAGRTAFLGMDSTWRWRGTAEPYFNRFWVQAVRYLGQARRQGASKRGTIVVDRERIQTGDYIKLEVRLLDADFAPWHAEQITGELDLSDETRAVNLQASPGRPGWYTARVSVDWAGPTTLRVPLPDGDPGAALQKRMHVLQPNREMNELRARPELLQSLAEATAGRFAALADADRLPDWIPDATRETRTRGADRPLWDRTWVLLTLAALLGVEWTLRRRHHLL